MKHLHRNDLPHFGHISRSHTSAQITVSWAASVFQFCFSYRRSAVSHTGPGAFSLVLAGSWTNKVLHCSCFFADYPPEPVLFSLKYFEGNTHWHNLLIQITWTVLDNLHTIWFKTLIRKLGKSLSLICVVILLSWLNWLNMQVTLFDSHGESSLSRNVLFCLGLLEIFYTIQMQQTKNFLWVLNYH